MTLLVRAAQLQCFTTQALDRFIDEATTQLAERRPVPFGDPDDLREIVATEARRACAHGLRSPRALRGFLHLATIYGPGFETTEPHGWMRAYLADARVSSPDDRLALLLDECIRRRRVREANDRIRAAHSRSRTAVEPTTPAVTVVPLPAPFALLEASA